MSQTLCVRCRLRLVDRRTVGHTCRRCQGGRKPRVPIHFRHPCAEWIPPVSADPTRESRILRYQERAAANLPLFG